jgi:hypothetical protein
VHIHILARLPAAVALEKILPRFRVEVEAVETKLRAIGDAFTRGFEIGVKRLEKISEPDTQERTLLFQMLRILFFGRLPHQSAVLIPDPRNIFPLLRIVITTMEQPTRFKNVIHIYPIGSLDNFS